MKFGVCKLVTLVLTSFLLVPTVLPDDTREHEHARNNESTNATPSGSVEPKPAGRSLLSSEIASSGHAPAGEGTGRQSPKQAARSHDNTTPKAELFLGYSYWRAVPQSPGNRVVAMHGGSTSLAYNLNSHVGLVFDFGGFRDDSLKFNSPGAGFGSSRVVVTDGNVFPALLGPRLSFRNRGRLTPFLQILGGAARASEVSINGCAGFIRACQPLSEETAFALTAGGGFDLRLNHRIALRLVQAEYLLTRFQDPTSLTGRNGSQNDVRLSTGIVFGFR